MTRWMASRARLTVSSAASAFLTIASSRLVARAPDDAVDVWAVNAVMRLSSSSRLLVPPRPECGSKPRRFQAKAVDHGDAMSAPSGEPEKPNGSALDSIPVPDQSCASSHFMHNRLRG